MKNYVKSLLKLYITFMIYFISILAMGGIFGMAGFIRPDLALGRISGKVNQIFGDKMPDRV